MVKNQFFIFYNSRVPIKKTNDCSPGYSDSNDISYQFLFLIQKLTEEYELQEVLKFRFSLFRFLFGKLFLYSRTNSDSFQIFMVVPQFLEDFIVKQVWKLYTIHLKVSKKYIKKTKPFPTFFVNKKCLFQYILLVSNRSC